MKTNQSQGWRTYLTDRSFNIFKLLAKHWKLSHDELVNRLAEYHSISKSDNKYDERIASLICEFLNACDDSPSKSGCPTCGQLNLLFDDCGYFYSHTEPSIIKENYWTDLLVEGDTTAYVPRCKACKFPHTAER